MRVSIVHTLAVSLTLLGAVAAQAATEEPSPVCETLKEQQDLYKPDSPAPHAFLEFNQDALTQRARKPVHDEIARRFGEDTKQDMSVQLSRGLIGTALDYERQALAVVVDSSKVNIDDLQSELNNRAAMGSRSVPGSKITPVRVMAGCHSAKDLVETYQRIRDQKALGGAPYGYAFNARNSTWRIYTSANAELAEQFANTQGGRVTVTKFDVGPGEGTRYQDAQPHWGGAQITNRSNGGRCSSGFTVNSRTSSEGQAIVTAGHCVSSIGGAVDSGSFFYGNYIRRGNFPLNDSALINANQNYDDNIYTGTTSGSTSNIDIAGKALPNVGDSVCVSGQVSRHVCNVVVEGIRGACPQAGGETTLLIEARRAGTTIFQRGDSGSPMYLPTGGDLIAGMNVCGFVDNAPYDFVQAEKYTSIESNLGVCVATSATYQACP